MEDVNLTARQACVMPGSGTAALGWQLLLGLPAGPRAPNHRRKLGLGPTHPRRYQRLLLPHPWVLPIPREPPITLPGVAPRLPDNPLLLCPQAPSLCPHALSSGARFSPSRFLTPPGS